MTQTGPGFYQETLGRTPVQGFPGLHILLSTIGNREFNSSGLLTAMFGGILIYFFFLVCNSFIEHHFISITVTLILAISIPCLYVTRITFSEPFGLIPLLVGTLLMLKGKRPQLGNSLKLGLFTSTLSALFRPDAIVSSIVPLFLLFIFTSQKLGIIVRRFERFSFYVFTLSAHYLSYQFSPIYFQDLKKPILTQLLFFLFIVSFVELVVFGKQSTSGKALWNFAQKTYSKNYFIIAIGVTASFSALNLYRILVIRNIDFVTSGPWVLVWYFSPLIFLPLISGLLALSSCMKNECSNEFAWLSLIYLLAVATYFFDSQISPDQPWGSRHLISLVIPIFLIICGIGAKRLNDFTKREVSYV
jgi:hypothetical protein